MKKIFISILAIILCSQTLFASKEKKIDAYNDTIKKCTRYEGLFTMWRDTVNGKTYLEIKTEQLSKEFIYFSFIADAPSESYQFRGNYNGSKIIRFDKKYDHVEINQVNTNFYFDPKSPLSKASQANINNPVLDNEKIIATSADGKNILLDADNIFTNEKLQLVTLPAFPGSPPPALGTLSKDKSQIDRINNYPQNTALTVKLVYENAKPPADNHLALADARSVSVYIQHTLIEVPKNDFQPRIFDPRIGYFTEPVNDQTTLQNVYWRDIIFRWNLVKKNPEQALSEPVEPITFWIENTTPVEVRLYVQEAVENWNKPFEKAGFKNAVVCKTQPDTATWDAGDIRYNVIRWTSSPDLQFWAYGPSFVNPRTGQILGADVMIEFDMLRTGNFQNTIFKTPGNFNYKNIGCTVQEGANVNLQAGLAAMDVLGMSDVAKKELVRQTVINIVEHELGHTFGLTHNFHASTMLSPDDFKNKTKLAEHGIGSSVMDYYDLNLSGDEKNNSLFYDTLPGIYDEWAIEFGYTPSLNDPVLEAARMKIILDRSVDPRLEYGNDDDIMRGTGRGFDPDVQQYDNSNNPLAYSINKCSLFNEVIPKLKEKFATKNQSYQELLNSFMFVMWFYKSQLFVITKHIGGVHYDHSGPGQAASSLPLEPVKEGIQMQAMDGLTKYAFTPEALTSAANLYNYLLPQRRGLTFYGSPDSINDDPHLHDFILGIQSECLDNLLNEKVLMRIIDSHLYGNTYTIDKVFMDLTDAIFNADVATPVNTIRQNLQSEYVSRLIAIADKKSDYDNVSKSMAMEELIRINKLESSAAKQDFLTNAHRAHIGFMIDKFFNEK